MFKKLWILAVGAALLAGQSLPAGAAVADQTRGRYIVELVSSARPGLKAAEARTSGVPVSHIYRKALRGYAAELTAADLSRLSRDPNVARITRAVKVSVSDTQNGATWGLDRTDQRNRPLDGKYTYDGNGGTGVNAYIIDTGIAPNTDFGGRLGSGYTVINDGNGTVDCHGHGTHVAGTVGSNTYGISKKATLIPIRVLDCAGSGWDTDIIAAIEWIITDHAADELAVANMSLGGGNSTALDAAVTNLIADGVTTAVAAGNSNVPACWSSPASAAAAITVGATTSTDTRSSFSNYGSCVDIFAPGSSITSLNYLSGNTSSPLTWNGTSMATPHVAGVAANILSQNPTWTPAQVEAKIKADASVGLISSPGTGSPNLLLYNDGLVANGAVISSFSPTAGAVGTEVTITGSNLSTTSAVTVGATAASIVGTPTATTVVITIPDGAATGKIALTTASSSATSTGDFTVTVPGGPTISSVSPLSGSVGTVVTITGTNFVDGGTTVNFNGTAATPTTVTTTSISVPVPSGATTGAISVYNGTATATSASFTVVPAPTPVVSRFSPSSGAVGTVVTITGSNFFADSVVKFNGTTATPTSISGNSITVPVPAGATTGRITVANGSSIGTSGSNFTVRIPTVTRITPTSAGIGSALTITGTYLSAATGVRLNGVDLSPFFVVSASTIVVGVPAGASSGQITVLLPSGNITLGTNVTFTGNLVAPTITSLNSSLTRSRTYTVSGANLGAARSLTINGTTVAFTVASAGSLRFTVPSGLTTGSFSFVITTDGGTVTRTVTIR